MCVCVCVCVYVGMYLHAFSHWNALNGAKSGRIVHVNLPNVSGLIIPGCCDQEVCKEAGSCMTHNKGIVCILGGLSVLLLLVI